MIKKILLGLLIVFVAIQFIRPEKNTGQASSGKDITHYTQAPDSVVLLLKVACYDCHSNHTNYPWYSEINPIGLWLADHVEDGKKEFNFSDVSGYSKKKLAHKLHEVAEQVEDHEMPLKSYTLLHTNARLSEQQRKMIVEWAEGEQKKMESSK